MVSLGEMCKCLQNNYKSIKKVIYDKLLYKIMIVDINKRLMKLEIDKVVKVSKVVK